MTIIPATKAARQQLVIELLSRNVVRSQGDLIDLLAAEGLPVTQTTLSRDLVDLDAVRVRHHTGGLVYAVPSEGGDRTPVPAAESASAYVRMARLCTDLLVSAEGSANLVVLRTPPGAAQFFASAIDHAGLGALLGTIAGDDSVLVICKDPQGGEQVVRQFTDLAAQVTSPKETP